MKTLQIEKKHEKHEKNAELHTCLSNCPLWLREISLKFQVLESFLNGALG